MQVNPAGVQMQKNGITKNTSSREVLYRHLIFITPFIVKILITSILKEMKNLGSKFENLK